MQNVHAVLNDNIHAVVFCYLVGSALVATPRVAGHPSTTHETLCAVTVVTRVLEPLPVCVHPVPVRACSSDWLDGAWFAGTAGDTVDAGTVIAAQRERVAVCVHHTA